MYVCEYLLGSVIVLVMADTGNEQFEHLGIAAVRTAELRNTTASKQHSIDICVQLLNILTDNLHVYMYITYMYTCTYICMYK